MTSDTRSRARFFICGEFDSGWWEYFTSGNHAASSINQMNVTSQTKTVEVQAKTLRGGMMSAHDAVGTPKRRAGSLALDAAERTPKNSLAMKAILEKIERFGSSERAGCNNIGEALAL